MLTLFLVSSDVKWLEIKQRGEDSVKTGGWDTPGLMRAIKKKKHGRSYVVERMAVCSTLSPNLLSCCSPSPSRGWALQHKRGSLYLKATGEIKEKAWHFLRCKRPERLAPLSHNSQFILFYFIYLFFREKWVHLYVLICWRSTRIHPWNVLSIVHKKEKKIYFINHSAGRLSLF